MKLNVDKIYITHWSKLSDRKIKLINDLTNLGITDYTWVESYDKDTWNVDDIKKEYPFVFEYNSTIKRNLRWSEISLVLKHVEIVKDILKNNYKSALILEDDVVFVDNFVEKYNQYLSALPEDWDACWVGTCCNIHAPYSQGQHLYKQKGSRCTHAYVISLSCAKKIQDELKNINDCADWFYNLVIDKYNLNNYWVEPPLVYQNMEFKTTIQTNNYF